MNEAVGPILLKTEITMDDMDLRGMSAADAKAYVFEFLTTLKATELELARIKTDMDMWNKRVELAISKGVVELEAAARAKVAELLAKFSELETERDSIRYKVSRMKEKLPMVAASERTVDADLLLAQLQIATGEALGGMSAASVEGLKSLGADDELAALKRKMSGEPDPSTPPNPPSAATPPDTPE